MKMAFKKIKSDSQYCSRPEIDGFVVEEPCEIQAKCQSKGLNKIHMETTI